MKKFLLALMLFVSMLTFVSCDVSNSKTSDQIQKEQQEKQLKEATRELGMPNIVNFQEKKTLKWILELRDDEKILNYAYSYSEMTGKFTYIGRCIGFPIPYATQYTSPQRPAGRYETQEAGNIALPQADPNGLYSPADAEGTWILLVNPKTSKPHPLYMEPKVTVSAFPLPDEICTINVKEK